MIIHISTVNGISTLATRGRSNINSLGLMPRFQKYMNWRKLFDSFVTDEVKGRIDRWMNKLLAFFHVSFNILRHWPIEKVKVYHKFESLLSWTVLCSYFCKTNFLDSSRFHTTYNHGKNDKADIEWHSWWEQEAIREKSKAVSLIHQGSYNVEVYISGGRL